MNDALTWEGLKFLYKSHRQYTTPILMIFVSMILVFVALLPLFNDLLNTLSQRDEATRKLQVLKNNLEILSAADEGSLDMDLAVTFKALPQEKDFESVLNTLSAAASKAGVLLGNFEFRVGDLSKAQGSKDQLPSLAITLLINDGVVGAARFMSELATTLPISDVKSVDINGDFTNITMLFYYKSIGSANTPPEAPIAKPTAQKTELLEKLLAWDIGSVVAPALPVSSASESAASPF